MHAYVMYMWQYVLVIGKGVVLNGILYANLLCSWFYFEMYC